VHWPVRVEAHERTYVDLSRLDSLKPLRWAADEVMLGIICKFMGTLPRT